MNHKWNYRPITPEQAETSQTLAQELGISPILGQLLVQRGITKAADAKKFFRPQLPIRTGITLLTMEQTHLRIMVTSKLSVTKHRATTMVSEQT